MKIRLGDKRETLLDTDGIMYCQKQMDLENGFDPKSKELFAISIRFKDNISARSKREERDILYLSYGENKIQRDADYDLIVVNTK